eukprot:1393803-Amorphochlora_amoeboformis.AAC.1
MEFTGKDSLDSVDASQENARDSARDNARDNARENARDKGGPSGNDSGSGVVESGSSQVRAVASSSCSAWYVRFSQVVEQHYVHFLQVPQHYVCLSQVRKQQQQQHMPRDG